MALFTENMTKEEKQQKALTIMRMGSPLSDDERDEISKLLFLTWEEYWKLPVNAPHKDSYPKCRDKRGSNV